MLGSSKITKTVFIEGMSCKHCSKKVENALKELENVKSVKVDLEQNKAELTISDKIDNDEIIYTIEELGYNVKDII